jgi:hypothetical protein
MRVRYCGPEEYHSLDQGNDNAPIDLVPGQSAEVSDEKAVQLEEDFPGWFEFDVDDEDDLGGGSEFDVATATASELAGLSRAKLDEIAAAVGVQKPEALANKGQVVEAILDER